jgi:drug/metabolite transporter (DMT)-like permease
MPKDATAGTAWEMLIGGVAMAVLSLGFREGLPDHVSGRSAFAIAYLVVFGSLVAFTAYVWLLQNVPISQVATYAYVNPVVAVGLGMLILGEPLTASVVLGGAVIVAAVLIVVTVEGRAQSRERRRVAAEPAAAGAES